MHLHSSSQDTEKHTANQAYSMTIERKRDVLAIDSFITTSKLYFTIVRSRIQVFF